MPQFAGPSPCCIALIAALTNKVFLPGSQGYNESLSSYYDQQETALQPACVVKPATSTDVSTILSSISSAILEHGDRNDPQCYFAVRSGGHNVNTAAANIEGGVTIDLRTLNGIELLDGVASVGVGATWDQVYSTLEPVGLSVAGGRNAGVGVGGLTTGGGLSFFSPRYGWTCDTVVSFEVVLANGSIVTTSADQHPELLAALRGGSNNFGIITSVDLQTFEQGSLWGGLSFYSLSTLQDQLEAFVGFNKDDGYDEYASLILSFVLLNGQPPAIGTNLEYTKPVENPPALQPFTSIPAESSTLRIANMSDLSYELASIQPNGLRQLWAEVTFVSTLPMLQATFQQWNQSLVSVQDISNISWTITLEPLPPSIYARHASSNSLGLGNRSVPLVVCLLTASWVDPTYDERINQAAESLIGDVTADAKRLGAYDPFIYLNYAAAWQDPIASYGENSVDRLRKVQRDVDPFGVFTSNVPGGFKVPPRE